MAEHIPKWNESPNNIVLRFPPLAGGKFVITLLSYYDDFFYPMPIRRSDVLLSQLSNRDLKSFTHYYAMKSIPDKSMRHLWSYYEAFMPGFWGFPISSIEGDAINKGRNGFFADITLDNSYDIMSPRVVEILQEFRCFHVTHESSYEWLTRTLPSATIINLVGYKFLQSVAKRFKSHHDGSLQDINPCSGPNVLEFDMTRWYNKNAFLDQIDKLAIAITSNNKVDSKIEQYYDAYIDVHSI